MEAACGGRPRRLASRLLEPALLLMVLGLLLGPRLVLGSKMLGIRPWLGGCLVGSQGRRRGGYQSGEIGAGWFEVLRWQTCEPRLDRRRWRGIDLHARFVLQIVFCLAARGVQTI